LTRGKKNSKNSKKNLKNKKKLKNSEADMWQGG